MHGFSGSEHPVPHVVLCPGSGLDGVLFSLVVKVQADFCVDPNPEVVVHHTSLFHLVPILKTSRLYFGTQSFDLMVLHVVDLHPAS